MFQVYNAQNEEGAITRGGKNQNKTKKKKNGQGPAAESGGYYWKK
jgi:hypothetical protein